jgi:hypothetical protein
MTATIVSVTNLGSLAQVDVTSEPGQIRPLFVEARYAWVPLMLVGQTCELEVTGYGTIESIQPL